MMAELNDNIKLNCVNKLQKDLNDIDANKD